MDHFRRPGVIVSRPAYVGEVKDDAVVGPIHQIRGCEAFEAGRIPARITIGGWVEIVLAVEAFERRVAIFSPDRRVVVGCPVGLWFASFFQNLRPRN